jgi:single-stranded-DNA-specific exonuclease
MIGVELLITDDDFIAKGLAERLDAINVQRKAVEEKVTEEALGQFEDRVAGEDRKIAIAVVPEAHEGIVGISAGRLKEAYDCPAIVLAKDHEGNLKGSARSVKGFDIGHCIVEARNKGLILRGGGHGMAGGLSLTEEQLPAFEEFANEEIRKSAYFRDGLSAEADLKLSAAELTVSMIEDFARMEPFGTGNTSPMVILENITITDVRILKEKHLKLTVAGGKENIDAMMWGVVGSPIGDFLMNSIGIALDLYGEPQINEWRGKKKVQIIVEDVREHTGLLI